MSQNQAFRDSFDVCHILLSNRIHYNPWTWHLSSYLTSDDLLLPIVSDKIVFHSQSLCTDIVYALNCFLLSYSVLDDVTKVVLFRIVLI